MIEDTTDRKRGMKRRGAAQIRAQRDQLAGREQYAKQFAYGALWALAMTRGKTADWWGVRVKALYAQEDCRLFDVMRRIGAVYIGHRPPRAATDLPGRYPGRKGNENE